MTGNSFFSTIRMIPLVLFKKDEASGTLGLDIQVQGRLRMGLNLCVIERANFIRW